jgi:hypothetical protein
MQLRQEKKINSFDDKNVSPVFAGLLYLQKSYNHLLVLQQ